MGKSVIWKFDVHPEDDGSFDLALPADARVLTFDYDGRGQLCAWAEIPDASKTNIMPKRQFRVIPTGQEFDPAGKYVNTIFMRMGSAFGTLVFHIYELTP